jgi:hypothetical protein
MTPKEKADELYTRYESLSKTPFKSHQKLKESALIAVDEILDLYLEESRNTRYWEDVKEEIENLKTK